MSNETQKVSPAKTKSAHKLRYLLGISIFIVVGFIISVFFVPSVKQNIEPHVQLRNATFAVFVADTNEERIQGLSGSNALPEMTGMLFDFPEPAQQCIWMKDMKYAIDIIWMDSSGKITDIKKRATPESYPEQFCSSDAVRYVLELPVGSVDEEDIELGDTAKIQL